MNKLQVFSKYLPYGVVIKHERVNGNPVLKFMDLTPKYFNYAMESQLFLRPLESLTEEEWLGVFKAGMISEYVENCEVAFSGDTVKLRCKLNNHILSWICLTPGEFSICPYGTHLKMLPMIEAIYALHVDIHNAIELGWAIDKTKLI